ncbi:MAG: type I-C CRISPR-associated protein Cas7/Csd2 [Akkermansiaceae bacterium]|nr:type I-C CRISPR-associated protein Cas7/Csd2 [Akkermansiaceae bacterium]
MSITNKIDFAVIFTVKNANPNGDPLNGNRPRTTYEGIGEMSDVCIKRKIRNRIMHEWVKDKKENDGYEILIQSDDNKLDDCTSIRSRVDASGIKTNDKDFKQKSCKKWFDVRAFGQVFAFSKGKGDGEGVSIPIRGPVSIHPAFSLAPISVSSSQITKSTNSEDNTKAGKKADDKTSDTFGMKHRVDNGTYVFFGSINHQLSTLTGFSDADANKIKNILTTLFENDASSARPDGSMEVKKVIWWQHSCASGDVSSAKVHQSVNISDDGKTITAATLKFTKDEKELELTPEVIEGF